jgi:CheY-like chemotaxis protein/anti-sigma regulatory factor (Ser/Thr protein kinase)
MGDATRIKQILTNLLTNAIKYNVEGGEVRLRVRSTRRGDGSAALALEVADSGIGLSDQQVEQLFQPFNRLGRERSGAEGTGIGLVISRRLAELMSGDLTVTSRVGLGSTFALVLPVTEPLQRAAPVAASAQPGDASYRQRHVLYIEDNATNIEVMRGILAQRPQIHYAVAVTGSAGLEAVRRGPVHLVLLDMHLPDMDGLAVLHSLQAEGWLDRTPVVAVSADAMQSQIDAALRAGAVHYLTKPVAVTELLQVVDERLEAMDTQFG